MRRRQLQQEEGCQNPLQRKKAEVEEVVEVVEAVGFVEVVEFVEFVEDVVGKDQK